MATCLAAAAALAVVASSPLRTWLRMEDNSSKTVLVTGAASGIGRAITLELLRRGDRVVGCDLSEQALLELQQAHPGRFLALTINVSDAKSVQQAAQQLKQQQDKSFSQLDAIVNNAGVMRGGPLTEMPDSDLEISLGVNVLGTFYVTKYFFPFLRMDDGTTRSRIINLGSEISYVSLAACFNGPYAMSKFAVEAYSQSLRQELGLLGPGAPHVVVINPGAHMTAMVQRGKSHVGVVEAGSKLARAVVSGNLQAQAYMDRHAQPAECVAEEIAHAIHLTNPPYRVTVNMSLEMLAMKHLPQTVLDFAVGLIFA